MLDALEREDLHLNMCPCSCSQKLRNCQFLPFWVDLEMCIEESGLLSFQHSYYLILKDFVPKGLQFFKTIVSWVVENLSVTVDKIVRLLVSANESLSAELQKSWVFRKNRRCCFLNRAVDVGPCSAQHLHQSQSQSTPLKLPNPC